MGITQKKKLKNYIRHLKMQEKKTNKEKMTIKKIRKEIVAAKKGKRSTKTMNFLFEKLALHKLLMKAYMKKFIKYQGRVSTAKLVGKISSKPEHYINEARNKLKVALAQINAISQKKKHLLVVFKHIRSKIILIQRLIVTYTERKEYTELEAN